MLIKHLPTDQPDDPILPSQARRQWLTRIAKAGAGTVILSLAGTQIARGANIVAVRVWPAEDYTRVTIESDVALKATHQLIKDPDRLMVDVEGLDLNPTLRELVAKITPNDPYIRQVRVGQNRPSVVRLVFDLKESVNPQVFTLLPIAGYRNRLVFRSFSDQILGFAPALCITEAECELLGQRLRHVLDEVLALPEVRAALKA